MYLLGDFGVRVCGADAILTAPVHELRFGDITSQGLPFYGGNLTYHLDAEIHGDTLELAVTNYRGHLLRASVDGKDAGVIAFAPYRVKAEGLRPGWRKIDLTCFGNRFNTFGQLHWTEHPRNLGGGPDAWRTKGAAWSYEYRPIPMGVLKSPEVW